MYFLKQCPRCNGDLATDSDKYGEFVSCLQCGYCKDIQAAASESPVFNPNPAPLSRAAALSKEGYRKSALHPQSGQLSEAIPA